MVDCEDEIAKRQVFDAFGNNVGGYLMFQCASDQDFGDDPFHLETEMYAYNTLACPEPPAKPVGRMQTRMFNWRGNEGSQTDVLHESVANLETWEDSSDPEIIPENDELRWPAYTRPSTGLIYMQARYYEPETGRFTQADPVPYGPELLLGAQNNRWTYCANDPVNYSDPTGNFWFVAAIIALTVVFALGFAWGLYFGAKNSKCTLTLQQNLIAAGVAALFGELLALGLGYWFLAGLTGILAPIVIFLVCAAFAFLAGFLLGGMLGEAAFATASPSAKERHRRGKFRNPESDIPHGLCPVYA